MAFVPNNSYNVYCLTKQSSSLSYQQTYQKLPWPALLVKLFLLQLHFLNFKVCKESTNNTSTYLYNTESTVVNICNVLKWSIWSKNKISNYPVYFYYYTNKYRAFLFDLTKSSTIKWTYNSLIDLKTRYIL